MAIAVHDTGNETFTTGYWWVTYTGKVFDPLDPDPSQICIEDIAHHLANSCRFVGAVKSFYSTAQHSVLVSYLVDKELRLPALLHDASEFALSDIAAPVKHNPAFGTVYGECEERLMQAVAVAFYLDYPLDPAIKVADKMMLRAEQRDLMPNDPSPGPIYDREVVPWSPYDAERMFLSRYNTITGAKVKIPRKREVSLWDLKRDQRRKD
jgi:uncharacterized protein